MRVLKQRKNERKRWDKKKHESGERINERKWKKDYERIEALVTTTNAQFYNLRIFSVT
jgi:hypothetical protein